MRVACLSLDFGLLLLLALVALIHVQGTTAAAEVCPSDKCVPSEHCEWPVQRGKCPGSGATCCSLLKREFRTLCRHHGGTCMDECNARLTQSATDCPAHKTCCVLV